MDFQLKLTFTGKNHKDLVSQSTKSLETLFRLISTLIWVKAAIMQSKWKKIFIKTRKTIQFFKMAYAPPKLSTYPLNIIAPAQGHSMLS